MVKPFSIQAPESIAKEYAGNKQRIAEAMQMGLIDPTAGVLAGMFIDRMRGAQVMEGANPPTVAQQVMGGAPPAQPAPPLPAGGLGATAPAAPPMAPEMGMAPPMPEEAPMGMADGGLATLPVSDAMFDEPTNGGFDDGYAGGGLVAFAGGGSTNWGTYIEEQVRKLDPNIQISGRARTPARNAEVGGVANSFHIIDAARDIRTPEGMDKNEFIAQLKGVFGPDYDVIPSKGRSVHVEPGPKLGEKVRGGARPSNTPAVMPERNPQTAEGRSSSLMDQIGLARSLYGELPEGGLGELEAYYRKELDPEEQRARRKEDMWATLTQIGAGMASSDSPSFLQAVGEAIGAALPGANASRKERREAERDARKGLQEVLGIKRKDQKEIIEFAKDMHAVELGAEIGEVERAERRALSEEERQFRSNEAALQHTRELERIREQGQIANSQFEQVVAANRQRLLDQLDQGLPIRDPDGNVIPTKSGRLSNSAIEVLAQRLALKQINQYRASQGSATSPVTEATQPRGGAGGTGGGAEAPIMLDPM